MTRRSRHATNTLSRFTVTCAIPEQRGEPLHLSLLLAGGFASLKEPERRQEGVYYQSYQRRRQRPSFNRQHIPHGQAGDGGLGGLQQAAGHNRSSCRALAQLLDALLQFLVPAGIIIKPSGMSADGTLYIDKTNHPAAYHVAAAAIHSFDLLRHWQMY